MNIQITLVDRTNTYKAHSTIIKGVDTQGQSFNDYYTAHKKELQTRAIENICHQLRCNWSELKKQGFTQVKAREYDLEKIQEQQIKDTIRRYLKKMVEKKGSGNNE